MDNIILIIGEIWWTHIENPMALHLLVTNTLNLNIEWTDDKNIR